MPLSRQNVRLAIRSFVRHPGFTVVAVLSLALAISLNTTMYSVIDALVYPKVEMRDPGQLYRLSIWGDRQHLVSPPALESLLASSMRSYEAFSSYHGAGYQSHSAVIYGTEYQESQYAIVAPNLLRVLGVRPVAGRVFDDADVYAAGRPVVISDRLAAALSPAKPFPMGGVIDVDGDPRTVIGVLGAGAQMPGDHVDVFELPAPADLATMVPNVVRLRPGTSLQEASAEMRMLADRFSALARETPKDEWFQLVPVTHPQFQFHNFHYALIAAVIAVLLVACANLANLQVARGLARSRELAVRTALGAARRDLIAQLLVESSVLGAAGLAAGLLATVWGVHLLRSRIPPAVAEYVVAPQTSWRVFLFALAACLVCILLVGLLPAIRVSRVDANELLKAGAGTGSHKHNQRRYGAMVVIELGLTLAVLSGTSILIHSALAYDDLRPNYDIRSLTTASFGVRFPRGDTVVRYVDLANAVTSRVRGVPDVANVAMEDRGGVQHDTITVELADGGTRVVPVGRAGYSIVSPSYLRTFGLPLLRGRDFEPASTSGGEVIVDAPTAAYLWRGQNPVGGAIKLGSPASSAPWVPVVGVAAATNDQLPTRDNPYPIPPDVPHVASIYYSPSPSDSYRISTRYEFAWVGVVVRAKTDPARMPIALRTSLHIAPSLRAFLTAPAPADPQFALTGAREYEDAIGLRTARQAHDFVASVFSAFAGLALALSGIGIYGLVAHSVAERRRELGVRLALGASTRHILEVVLREGNALMLGGVAFGLLLTKYTVAWLWDFIFEDDKWNAPLFAEMGAVIIVVAVVAAIVPALRAARIDPVESLRSE